MLSSLILLILFLFLNLVHIREVPDFNLSKPGCAGNIDDYIQLGKF